MVHESGNNNKTNDAKGKINKYLFFLVEPIENPRQFVRSWDTQKGRRRSCADAAAWWHTPQS